MIYVAIVKTFLIFHLLLIMLGISTLCVEVIVFTFLNVRTLDKRNIFYNCIIHWNSCSPKLYTLARHACLFNCKKFAHIDQLMILQSVKMIEYYLQII